MDFKFKVLEVVKSIPKGETLSYKEVAIRAGNPNGARGVGSIMRNNQDNSVPCHRVIRSDGELGGYNRLRGEKADLLRSESMNL
ncbi:MGMT family protein [Patescibacteria group bacterium]